MPKILLVEDNEMNRDMLSRRLVHHGYEVVIGDERQARSHFDGHEPAGDRRLGGDASDQGHA